MKWTPPERVLITGGREIGGVDSFAEGLSSGFGELGIPSEIIRPSRLTTKIGELRSRRILKILSTFGMLALPFARRAICMIHGVSLVPWHGWTKTLVNLGCYKMANALPSVQLVAVSDYIAVHMAAFYNLHIDAVVRNPVKRIYLTTYSGQERRHYITFVGRLIPCKNVHRILPAISEVLNENPDLRACIIGEGPERAALQDSAIDDQRIEFRAHATDDEIREHLRRTKVFVSGHPTEGFGITYAEALSQGCAVVMPASGGGLEIVLDKIGDAVHLLPISLRHSEVVAVFRRALRAQPSAPPMESYSPRAAASAYLDVDRLFFPHSPPLAETVRA